MAGYVRMSVRRAIEREALREAQGPFAKQLRQEILNEAALRAWGYSRPPVVPLDRSGIWPIAHQAQTGRVELAVVVYQERHGRRQDRRPSPYRRIGY